ncbi:MAG TPA: ATP-binding cassette domain-containing protein [Chloroflexota bacterium]|nr:ATP-binding cassette domain-containing protein [Chloroflexota bacterium]
MDMEAFSPTTAVALMERPASANTAAEPGHNRPDDREIMVDVRDLRKLFRRRTAPADRERRATWLPGRRRPLEDVVAVAGVSFAVRAGEIFGLLGPNGAGKSTTIRMLCTLLEPTSGSARIGGHDVVREAPAVRRRLGAVLTGERSIYWKLTGRENLAYFAALYHLPPPVAKQRIQDLLERLELAHRADEYVERYSSGMKQRIAIAKALLANPPVLLLDEPTIGLDPQAARTLRDLILELKRDGHTILLTTHYMEEADLLCDRIGIVDHGTIIALDTPAALKRSINRLEVVQIEVEGGNPALGESLRDLPAVQQVIWHQLEADDAWSIALHTADSRATLPALIERVGTQDGRIRNVTIAQPSLEDVFIALTGKRLRD